MKIKRLKNRNLEVISGGTLTTNEKGRFEINKLKFALMDLAETTEDVMIYIKYLPGEERPFCVYEIKR